MRVALRVTALACGAVVLLAPSEASAHDRCIEVSDTVGEHVCSRYGDEWSIERKLALTFRFGLRYGEMSTEGLRFSETFKKKDRPRGYSGYRFPGEALGLRTLAGLGADGGFTFFVVGQLYTGLDGGLAFDSTKTATFTTGRHTLSDAGGVDVVLFHGGVPVGYRVPLGRASLRGEVLLGGVLASVSQRYAVDDRRDTASAVAARWLVEPRIAGDIWFTQHVTVGAYAGTNLVDSRGHAFGLTLAWHHRAFDGDMSLW